MNENMKEVRDSTWKRTKHNDLSTSRTTIGQYLGVAEDAPNMTSNIIEILKY